jgi:hypothetical protein
VQLNDHILAAGDGATVIQVGQIILQGVSDDAEVLLFEMAE